MSPLVGSRAVQQRWQQYLAETPTYGGYHDRVPEYRRVAHLLAVAGLEQDDLIVDVGAGTCDLDHYLRTEIGWRGKYLPYDGAVQGIDLNVWEPTVFADFYVSVETLEHLLQPRRLALQMQRMSAKAVVVTTPNADVVDVLAVDPTHRTPLHRSDLEGWGYEVGYATLNPGRGADDTLLGVWQP